MNLLKKMEIYYNNKYKEISKLLISEKNYKIDFVRTKSNKVLLTLFDGNKILLNGDFNFYGIYQPHNKLWIWASSIPGVNSKQINKINKIKSLNHLFEGHENALMNFYYQLLTQDVILINNIDQLNWINRLLIYLSNDLYYFNPEGPEKNIQFIGLSNIIEKYV